MSKCKTKRMLELYRNFANKVDDHIEYGTVDRSMIKMFLSDLTTELRKLNETKLSN